MAEPVKSTRRYESPRRREQAETTRLQILEAAQRLFEAQGYAPTTMAAIAKEAGVALKTVYVAFQTKGGLLRAVWHLRLRGDEGAAPVQDRAWYREVLEEPDPVEQLRRNARNARVVKERIGGLLGVIRDAAPLDPDVAELWQRLQRDFYANQRAIVESLAEKGALRAGLDVDRGADILWTLNHPDVWLLLVRERGWASDAWEQWFEMSARTQLLTDARS